MITFNNFITKTKIYNKYASSTEAMAVFNYLNLNSSIDKMIQSSKENRPALEGVVDDLEKTFEDNKDFSFSKEDVKQCVGKMIKEIISIDGYVTDKDMKLSNKKFFKTAMRYKH